MKEHDRPASIHTVTTYQAGIVQANANRLLQKYCDEILLPFGITKNHWLIMGAVFDGAKDGMRISDLARVFGATLPYMTNTVNLLESKGLLERRAQGKDGRSKRIYVTEKAADNMEHIEETLRNGLRDTIYRQIKPEEFRVYLKVLHQLQEIA